NDGFTVFRGWYEHLGADRLGPTWSEARPQGRGRWHLTRGMVLWLSAVLDHRVPDVPLLTRHDCDGGAQAGRREELPALRRGRKGRGGGLPFLRSRVRLTARSQLWSK